jgi:hypothetical protein
MTGSGMAGMAGMEMGPRHGGGPGILPEWLAVIWLLVFAAIVASHCRHLLASHGQRRVWHAGHVIMAVGMTVMYATSVVHGIHASSVWEVVFGYAAAATLAWMLVQLLYRRAINVLWAMMVLDLSAMAYMWSPSDLVAPVSWLLVGYFSAQAALWAVSAHRRIDGRWQIAGGARMSPSGDGDVTLSTARSEPLICELEIRPSMIAMTLGMAYMFVAMQLLV